MINDNNWIPVSERLPEEYGTIFATFATSSNEVIVTVELEDGKRIVTTSKTRDGEWRCEKNEAVNKKVIAWQPFPEPYENKEIKSENPLGEIQLGKIVNIAGTDWIPLEHFENGGTLCIRKDIWKYEAFDENNSNNWKISSLREKLNKDFLMELVNQLKEHGLSTELIEIEQDLMADDGTTYGTCIDKVTLLTEEQYRKYKPYLEQLDGDWYWLLTAHSTTNHGVRYVYADGTLGYDYAPDGYDGVRPVCMFPYSIRVKE